MSLNLLGLFPGQGSQSVGMGHDLYETTRMGRDMFERADQALGFSLSSICFEGPMEKLTETAIAQPAILLVSTIYYELVRETTPLVAALGHSLGEYSALVAAGALQFEEALVLVNKRGRYMQEAVPVGEGRMVAVLGREPSEIEAAIQSLTDGVAEIANINAPGQIVVSGDVPGVEGLKVAMKGARLIDLPVSAPFHCSLMKPAADRLRDDLQRITIRPPTFPVFSNYYAKPLSVPEVIRESLHLQVCGKVRFTECLMGAIDTFGVNDAIEFGTGKVLAGLAKRTAPELKVKNVSEIIS